MVDYILKKQNDRKNNPRKEIEITMTKGSFLPKETLDWYQFHFPQSSTYDGFFQICYRGQSGFRPLWTGLQDNVEEFLGKMKIIRGSDYYITPNCSTTIRRNKAHLFAMQNIVIDIDCHNDSVAKEKKQIIFSDFRSELYKYSEVIPLPHSIVFTGRGLQLWWAIEPIHAKCLYFYNQVKAYFIHCLEDILKEHGDSYQGLAVDHAASNNVAGVFRLPGTHNPKARTKVYLERTQVKDPYALQDLEKLAKENGAKWREPSRQSSKYYRDTTGKILRDGMADVESFASTCQEDDLTILSGGNSFSYFRTKQLIQLFTLRDRLKGSEERNNFSLLAYSAFRSALTHEESWERLQVFNKKFKEPLTLRELEDVICSAKHKDGYRFSNKKVIDFLQITAEECDAISLYGKDDQFAVAPVSNAHRQHYYKVKKEHRNQQIQLLFQQNMPVGEIAKTLSISISTVNRVTLSQREANKANLLLEIRKQLDEGIKFPTIVKNIPFLSNAPKGTLYCYRTKALAL